MKLLNPLPQRLDTGATATFAGLLAGDGTAAAPSISFINDTDTGFYRDSSGIVGVASNGLASLRFGTAASVSYVTNAVTPATALGLANAGAVLLTAGGTNQNITLTPSGTGQLVAALAPSPLTDYSVKGFSILVSANQRLGFGYDTTTANGWGWIQSARVGVAFTPLVLQGGGSSVLVGTTTDSNNGILQLATHTTSAGGIGFGTDCSIYRTGAGTMGLTPFSYAFVSGNTTLNSTVGNLALASWNVTALTLDASQGATFSAAVAAGFCAKFNQVAGNNPTIVLQESGVSKAQWASFSGDVYFDCLTAGKSLIFRSGAQVTALTIDGSQNAAFAAKAAVYGTLTTAGGGSDGSYGVSQYYGSQGATYANTFRHKVETTHSGTPSSNKWKLSLCDGTSLGFVDSLELAPSGATFAGTVKPQLATTAGAPTYVKGAMYFDTTLNKLRIGGATAWETVTSV